MDSVGWLRSQAELLSGARHPDPPSFLGRHEVPGGIELRVFSPRTRSLAVRDGPGLERVPRTDLFVWRGEAGRIPERYELEWTDDAGVGHRRHDAYAFPAQVSDFERQVFGEGHHWHAWRFLGANPRRVDGVDGTLFSTWAPGARRVSVVGDFNGWDGRCHVLRRHPGGIWELFLPGVGAGAHYKFEILGRDGELRLKSDPYGRKFQSPPENASLVEGPSTYAWQDGDWLAARRARDWLHAPMSVYEVHLGSWRRGDGGRRLNYRDIAGELAAYAADLGFTHVELLPVSEHPFEGSWGYQTLGNFAPASRHGTPDDFRSLVDECHRRGLGVILDWVPAHFPRDAHGLAWYDGGPLYEYGDPRRGEHPDWSTLIYDYGRPEVRNYLLASALHWLEEYHADGLRVDAVASMLYLDYSRKPGEWLPNESGGRENLDAVRFLRELNHVVHERHPGAVVIAEESTAWPLVTRPTHAGGLGFSMKWNLGWMHDTLDYFRRDPVHRRYHHRLLTFSQLYAFSENFVLPLSHDEVVHGKGSLIGRMPGDDWQQFANLRLLLAYQWTHPGKKLLFMGQEFGQRGEWSHELGPDWPALRDPRHAGVQSLVRDLNLLHRGEPALHRHDFDAEGFAWIDCSDSGQSVVSFVRRAGAEFVVVALNFTPVVRQGYRIGVPGGGAYRELLNSDASAYGGSNVGNAGLVHAEPVPHAGQDCSLVLTLPPLAALILRPEATR
ncbi:MAG TPA: 1,4-alpha-glucan branching protein GlgB [Steroidobacteraceae bacterium]|nr:1,4-alpha-glucan branching protein GlgB [Steroidobacteraceae bacterium]